MFDPAEALAHAKAMESARAFTGRVCSDEDERASADAFHAWARELGLRGTFGRTLSGDGRVIWIIRLHTGRGELEGVTADPRKWRDTVRRLGLEP